MSPLHAIVDVDVASRAGWMPLDLARAFLDGGVSFVQLRAKQLASGAFLDLGGAMVALAKPYNAQVIINDRVDLGLLTGAAGVHVGQDDLPPANARRLLGPQAIIGYSTHSLDQLKTATAQPVSYIAVGPVFGTNTKRTGYGAVGLGLVSDAARAAGPKPVVAIGGVTLENARSVIDAGAAAVAVISDLLVGNDPERRTRAFLRSLTQNRV